MEDGGKGCKSRGIWKGGVTNEGITDHYKQFRTKEQKRKKRNQAQR